MLDSARQLIRWSIPGGLFILLVVIAREAPAFVSRVMNSSSAQLGMAWRVQLIAYWTPEITAPFGVIIVASAIPVGFMLYQLYYWRYEGARPFLWITYPADRGRNVLRQLEDYSKESGHNRAEIIKRLGRTDDKAYHDSQVSVRRSTEHILNRVGFEPILLRKYHALDDAERLVINPQGGITGKRRQRKSLRRFYSFACRENWHFVKSLLMLDESPAVQRLASEVRALSDIYHGLGATRGALGYSWVGATLFYALSVSSGNWPVYLVTWLLVCICWARATVVITGTRKGVVYRMTDEIAMVLHGAWTNPSPTSSSATDQK